jgi:hypothetical protein
LLACPWFGVLAESVTMTHTFQAAALLIVTVPESVGPAPVMICSTWFELTADRSKMKVAE